MRPFKAQKFDDPKHAEQAEQEYGCGKSKARVIFIDSEGG